MDPSSPALNQPLRRLLSDPPDHPAGRPRLLPDPPDQAKHMLVLHGEAAVVAAGRQARADATGTCWRTTALASMPSARGCSPPASCRPPSPPCRRRGPSSLLSPPHLRFHHRIGVPGLPPPRPIRNSSAVTIRISSAAAACANSCVGHMLGPLSALTRPAIPDAGRSAAAEPPHGSTMRDASSAPPSRHASAPSVAACLGPLRRGIWPYEQDGCRPWTMATYPAIAPSGIAPPFLPPSVQITLS